MTDRYKESKRDKVRESELERKERYVKGEREGERE